MVEIDNVCSIRCERRDEVMVRASVLSHEIGQYLDSIGELLDEAQKKLQEVRDAVDNSERLANDSGSYFDIVTNLDELMERAEANGGDAYAVLDETSVDYKRFCDETFGEVNARLYELGQLLGNNGACNDVQSARTYCLNAIEADD